ncbi:MAG: hypothetical protein Q9168_005994 [Polycauliona sp. 1 TL-2023]
MSQISRCTDIKNSKDEIECSQNRLFTTRSTLPAQTSTITTSTQAAMPTAYKAKPSSSPAPEGGICRAMAFAFAAAGARLFYTARRQTVIDTVAQEKTETQTPISSAATTHAAHTASNLLQAIEKAAGAQTHKSLLLIANAGTTRFNLFSP